MRSWVLAAALLAAVAVAVPAAAADLDDGSYPGNGASNGPGDDLDFDDEDEPSEEKHSRVPPPFNNGEDDEDNDGRPAGGKYSSAPPPYGKRCVRSVEVRDRLTRYGWRDFHAPRPRAGEVVTLRARRSNGRLYELALDRCTGRLVAWRPVERGRLRPFAPGEFDERRWGRSGSDAWFGPYAFRWPRDGDRDDD